MSVDEYSSRSLADFQALCRRVCEGTEGGRVQEFPSLLIIDSGSPESFLNSVTPRVIDRPISDDDFRAALEHCASSDSTFTWWWPASDPRIPQLSQISSLQKEEAFILMGTRLDQAPAIAVPPGVDIAPVESETDLRSLFEAAAQGFNDSNADVPALVHHFMPLIGGGHIRAFAALHDHRVAGSLLLHLDADDSTRAGIYWIAVPPELRRRGIATSLTVTGMRHALDLHRPNVVLQSSMMARSVYERLGFKPGRLFLNWIFRTKP